MLSDRFLLALLLSGQRSGNGSDLGRNRARLTIRPTFGRSRSIYAILAFLSASWPRPCLVVARYAYDPAGNLTKETNSLGEINYDYTYYRLLNKRYYMTFSRLGIVQTLRDLPSVLGLSKTLLHDVFSPRQSANTARFAHCARLIENVIAT